MKNKISKERIKSKKEYIIYSVILVAFIILASLISFKHEYWADEIATWLIAEDSSIITLFTKYLYVEGHPALFHLIIKLFSFFGLKFANFRFISLLFSSLGVALLLFKSNFKLYLKILLPFTYFIFYQYTVITRGYCLILLFLSLLAIVWEKRKEKCFLYAILLILFLNLEAYTFLISGSLYFLYIVEYIIDYKKTKKHNKKYLISLIIIFFSFLLTTIYIMPRPENTYKGIFGYYYISDSFITPYTSSDIIKGILSPIMGFALFIYYYFKKTKKEFFELIILIAPIYLFMNLKYCSPWHFGLPFLLFIFIYWIHNLNKSKVINLFLLLTCVMQIIWSVKSSVYDYKEKYTPVKEVADLIKTYDYENLKIFGQSYFEGAVNAYFDHNIYANWNEEIRFFYWSKKSKYYSISLKEDDIINKEKVDIYVASPEFIPIDQELLKEYYDEYSFEGGVYFENHIYEPSSLNVYVKKGLEKKA